MSIAHAYRPSGDALDERNAAPLVELAQVSKRFVKSLDVAAKIGKPLGVDVSTRFTKDGSIAPVPYWSSV